MYITSGIFVTAALAVTSTVLVWLSLPNSPIPHTGVLTAVQKFDDSPWQLIDVNSSEIETDALIQGYKSAQKSTACLPLVIRNFFPAEESPEAWLEQLPER